MTNKQVNKTTEALKLAEEALGNLIGWMDANKFVVLPKERKSLAAIREALAEPVKQEPVAILKSSKANFERQFGKQVFADWIYDDLTYSFENSAIVQQTEQEPMAWDLAEKVRRDLDRKSCPDAYMRIAMESIVKHYAAPASVEAAVLAEREACAKVCDEEAKSWARLNAQDEEGFGAIQCAAAIRGLK